jgi:hypothetical protein
LKGSLIKATTLLWAINEALQLTEALHGSQAEFFVFYSSSLFGAIIFCFLMEHFNWSRLLFLLPVFIELGMSWFTCQCVDYWDEIFSLMGIIIASIGLIIDRRRGSFGSRLFGSGL